MMPDAPIAYKSYDGADLTLHPWRGNKVAVLTSAGTLDASVMAKMLSALDAAFNVYAEITGRTPVLFKTYMGLDSIAQVPTTFGTSGGALGWLGATGIELTDPVFNRLYAGIRDNGQYDAAVFYEFGRNFWFYYPQLGPVDPFVTGFAVVNAFVSLERAGLQVGPFNGYLDPQTFKSSILDGMTQRYFSSSSATLNSTLGSGTAPANPNNWGANDLAASFYYLIYQSFGWSSYLSFFQKLSGYGQAADKAAGFANFINASTAATGFDFSFLDKVAGATSPTGSSGSHVVMDYAEFSLFLGLGGADSLTGTSRVDRILGGAGDDQLYGVGGSDFLGGGIGNDYLFGGLGQDVLEGSDGADLLNGGAEADVLRGGAGIDTASYEGDEGGVFVNLTLGRGYANASFGDTYDSIENVIGTDYNDFIIGDPGVNRLDGGAGNDTIIGAVGADAIVGGEGEDWASYEDNSGVVFINLTLQRGYNNAAEGDTYDGIENLVGGLMDDFFIGDENANRLNGAMGADTLLGAGGADIFMFTYAPGATSTWGKPNVDLILDFTTGEDKIELAATAFPGLAAGALPAAAFYAGTAAHDGDDRIIYDAATGKLWFDPDGTGGQAAMLFATLGETSHPATVAATDFVVV